MCIKSMTIFYTFNLTCYTIIEKKQRQSCQLKIKKGWINPRYHGNKLGKARVETMSVSTLAIFAC